ncbi:hypothetical protein [Gymnodinialimonas ceratoperidinii]|uniref:Right handed beta helix domain-containing protein n=1 Tax=Gymnodinialimonas ceratoperidinii TaxID=2856823 RepID=A0A8F6TVH2_9RHOB|nr:hypothetical protein [Gymnodinialimonas ceratoperidinii]QXT39450.1 hypothetical protein KYE46_16245 [Gymnodinialimonas ceratoperidinii]
MSVSEAIANQRSKMNLGTQKLSRRTTLLGMSSCLALTPALLLGETGTDIPLHISPSRSGDGDARDWENTASYRDFSRLATQASPGQRFLLGVTADQQPVEWSGQQVLLNAGGTQDAPLEVQIGLAAGTGEIDVSTSLQEPAVLRMTGNETGPDERPDVGGDPFFVLGPECSNLHITGPNFDRSSGKGFFNLDADGALTNLVFDKIHARTAGRVIEAKEETRIDGLLIEHCSALGLIRGFARFRDLSNAEFRDLDLDADHLDGGGNLVCQILKVNRGENLTFRRVRLANAVNQLGAEERGSSYIQGDGIVLEEETRAVLIEDCHAEGMGDGGFDLKTEGVRLTNCTTRRCKYGVRIWSHNPGNLLEGCSLKEPVRWPRNDGSCLWLAGTLTARDCLLESAEDMSPIRFGSSPDDDAPEPNLRLEGGEVIFSEGTDMITGEAGTLILENVAINGVETSGAFRWDGDRLTEVR